MKQSVVYKSSMGFFLFFRGGYDKVKKEGLDPFEYDTDPVCTAKGASPGLIVKHGQLISIVDSQDKIRIGRFFFGEDFRLDAEKDFVADGEFMLCFDASGRMIFYRKGDDAPVKAEKFCKTRNKFYKEWVKPYTEYGENLPPVTIRGYKFSKDQDYIICPAPHDYYSIIPEVLRRPECPQFGCFAWKQFFEYLYNLDPIDLSESWDYTLEEKTVFAEKIDAYREERRRYKEELEERRRTPGFCSVCGEKAELVEDPYAAEMYGEHRMVWLCPDCYHDAAMDV